MSEISVSERRLSAALDRIDQILEAGTGRGAQSPATQSDQDQALAAAQAEADRLAQELAALRADRGGPLEAALAEARARLDGAGQQAARLAAANEELTAANRALIDAAGQGDADPAIRRALEAEIESLRAAREAELSQMGDIMVELERLLAEDQVPAAPGQIVDPTLEAAGDEAGVPEATEARQTGKDGLPSDHDERSGNGGVADDDGFQEGNR
ncbi:hypothetical protein [Paracoccus sp. UBA5162]|uniref:hypothetical protein n=1 Tax=Paracoccus sp. UBA5162 TaxID=1947054 RepID=UPI0025CC7DC0|nr:hypothetical protein [Paracoccus sp. UBA5162]